MTVRRFFIELSVSYVAGVLLAMLFLLCLVTPASGQDRFPNATIAAARAKAAATLPHRLASVKIGGCSGTIIKIDGKYAYGISCEHCCSGVGDDFWFDNPDGKTGGNATWIAEDPSVDMALFCCWSENILGTAKVCEFLPDWTLRSEAIGYPRKSGGPAHKKLTYLRTIDQRINRRTVKRYSFSNDGPGYDGGGDSGGGIFYDGFLVGVHSHGPKIRSSSAPQVIAFLKRQKWGLFCASGDCGPGWHRPTYPVVIRPTLDPRVDELKKLVAALTARIEVLEKRKPLKGDTGPAGPQGRRGTAGSAGGDGRPGANGPAGPPGKVDVVISVDGKEKQRANGVKSGSVVRIPVRRILIEEK